LGPTSEYHPRSVAPVCTPAPALSRGFLPPRRHPLIEIHHSRAFACPGHVASSHLPRASTPCSLSELPGVLSTRCVPGTSPFKALPDRNRSNLSALLPLLRLASRPLQQTLRLLSFRTSEIGRHEDVLFEQTIKARPSRMHGAHALSAHRHCCQSGFASGVSSLCRLGLPAAGFLHVRCLGFLGLAPPWGIPLPSLSLDDCRFALANTCDNPARLTPCVSFRCRTRPCRALGLLSALRGVPVLGPAPCASECQRAGKLALPLPRPPAPKVFVLVLAELAAR
jgi:hypothetical protein